MLYEHKCPCELIKFTFTFKAKQKLKQHFSSGTIKYACALSVVSPALKGAARGAVQTTGADGKTDPKSSENFNKKLLNFISKPS